MRIFYYLAAVFLIASCSGNIQKKEDQSQPNLSIEESTDNKVHNNSQVSQESDVMTRLDSLITSGLEIADSEEQCMKYRFNTEPKTKLVFNYPQGSKLVLSEWEYGLTHNDFKLLDFVIFNCITDEILLEANYTIASYRLVDVKPNLSIEIEADLPNQNGSLTRQPFLLKRFIEKDSTIQIQTEILFDVTDITKNKLDSIKSTFDLRPILDPSKKNEIGDFATEELIIVLFKGALNGNPRAIDLFINLNDKYAVDGATGELYGAFKGLLNDF